MYRYSYGCRASLLILLTGALIIAAGCGKKGPPLPPDNIIPQPVKDLKAEGRNVGVELSWTVPEKNVDGSEPVDLAGFKLYRKVEGSCTTCPSEFPVYADVDAQVSAGMAGMGKRINFVDTDVDGSSTYHYKVAPYNSGGYYGEPSPVTTVKWEPPPSPPGGLSGAASDGSVALSWQPAARDEGQVIAGYRIYRRVDRGSLPAESVSGLISDVLEYTDRGLKNNTPYYYVVKSVVKSGDLLIEGLPSSEVMFIPVDMIPPSVPKGIVVIPADGKVNVYWENNEEPDLFGYNIYRRSAEEKRGRKVNDEPVKGSRFSDSSVKKGMTYIYAVTSVDDSPQKNESARSEEFRVVIP